MVGGMIPPIRWMLTSLKHKKRTHRLTLTIEVTITNCQRTTPCSICTNRSGIAPEDRIFSSIAEIRQTADSMFQSAVESRRDDTSDKRSPRASLPWRLAVEKSPKNAEDSRDCDPCAD